MEEFVLGFAVALILAAFLPNTAVTAKEWELASAVCAHNDGVQHVRGEGAIRQLKVVCRNGVEARPKAQP